jgi:Arc/MetJ-type ribon-helix-helix transcriptional regulator
MDTKHLTVSWPIPKELDERIGIIVESRIGYATKSEFIREAIRKHLDEKEKMILKEELK